MSKEVTHEQAAQKAVKLINASGVRLTSQEEESIVVTDFELGNLGEEGAQIIEWINTERVCVRLIALLPNQTLPQHYHKVTDEDAGKEEIIRMVSGSFRVYVPGEDTLRSGRIPEGKDSYYTVRHEIRMEPGDQVVLKPGSLHWFQSGDEGAVVYSFSNQSKDRLNVFSNPATVKGCRINEFE